MAVTVIHIFEMVDIDDHQRRRGIGAEGRKAFVEFSAVGKPGQWIMRGEMFKSLLNRFLIRNVGQRINETLPTVSIDPCRGDGENSWGSAFWAK